MGCGSSMPIPNPHEANKIINNPWINYPYPRQQLLHPTKNLLEVNPADYLPASIVQKTQSKLDDFGHQPMKTNFRKPDPEPKDQIVISEEYLEEYVKLEKNIHELECQKVLQRLHIAVDQLQCAAMEITLLEETKSKIDIELKSIKLGKGVSPEVTGRKLIEEIDAINVDGPIKNDRRSPIKFKSDDFNDGIDTSIIKKKEFVDEKLKEKQKIYEDLEIQVSELNARAAELLDMYLMQDELIVKIFSHGHSTTTEEAQLDQSLQSLEEKKARIESARRKWKEAQLLLEYACKQLAVAVQQWQNLPQVPHINLEVRYLLSDEASQTLKAAGEKLSVTRDDPSSEMPYCTSEELAALEAMAASSKSDVTMTNPLDEHSDTHKRAVAMLKWFNRVLNTAIHRDLVDVSEEVRVTSQALRRERINILRDRMKNKYGEDVNFKDIDFDDLSEDAMVKKMLSSCKNGHDCRIIQGVHRLYTSDDVEKGDLNGKVTDPKVPNELNEGSNVLISLKSEHERDMAKMIQGEREMRAKIQKNVDQRLNARREIRDRAGRSPNRDSVTT